MPSPIHGPLFYLELLLDENGSHYTCDLNEFENMLVSVFDRGIQSTQSVPQIEKVSEQLYTYSSISIFFTLVSLLLTSYSGL